MLATTLPRPNAELTGRALSEALQPYLTRSEYSAESVDAIFSAGWNAMAQDQSLETKVPGSPEMRFALIDLVLSERLQHEIMAIERDRSCLMSSSQPLGILPGNYGEAVLEVIRHRQPQNGANLMQHLRERLSECPLGETAAFCNRFRLWDPLGQLKDSAALAGAAIHMPARADGAISPIPSPERA